ncbi:hypothetical protein C8R44DRAFT_894463 [Mycena epipterygia]|nr:hypothetical protein C8R44DRAFT_894463 [Mycena epipterygia]
MSQTLWDVPGKFFGPAFSGLGHPSIDGWEPPHSKRQDKWDIPREWGPHSETPPLGPVILHENASSAVTIPIPGKSILKKPPPVQASLFSRLSLSRFLLGQETAGASNAAAGLKDGKDGGSGSGKDKEKDESARMAVVYPISSLAPPSTPTLRDEKRAIEERERERCRRVVRAGSTGTSTDSASVLTASTGSVEDAETWWAMDKVESFYSECCEGCQEVPDKGITAAFKATPPTHPRSVEFSGVQLTFASASILADVLSIEWGLRKAVFRDPPSTMPRLISHHAHASAHDHRFLLPPSPIPRPSNPLPAYTNNPSDRQAPPPGAPHPTLALLPLALAHTATSPQRLTHPVLCNAVMVSPTSRLASPVLAPSRPPVILSNDDGLTSLRETKALGCNSVPPCRLHPLSPARRCASKPHTLRSRESAPRTVCAATLRATTFDYPFPRHYTHAAYCAPARYPLKTLSTSAASVRRSSSLKCPRVRLVVHVEAANPCLARPVRLRFAPLRSTTTSQDTTRIYGYNSVAPTLPRSDPRQLTHKLGLSARPHYSTSTATTRDAIYG